MLLERNLAKECSAILRLGAIWFSYLVIETPLTSPKYVLLWAPVTPVIAVTYFEPKYSNDPVLMQYAHRVLEQHPVELTFFFVPQIVQALRSDLLGAVH